MLISREKVSACLLAVQIGDALGQPVETMKRSEILAAEAPNKIQGQPITSFLPAIQQRITGTKNLKAGDTTDDWQLTKVIAESIIACRGYNHDDIARRHVKAFQNGGTGWGKSTERGIIEITQWYETNGLVGRNPLDPAPKTSSSLGAGNGIAMKVSPIALYHGVRNRYPTLSILRDVQQLASLTHSDPRAALCAYALALTICRSSEYRQLDSNSSQSFLIKLIRYVEKAEAEYQDLERPTTSNQLRKLAFIIGDHERIHREITPGFLATQSVIYAIGIFLTFPTDFKKAVLTAVNDGQDSDSTASMVGALVAANCGLDCIPVEWQSYRPEYAETINLGMRLYEAAQL